jgi:hypothetical protein
VNISKNSERDLIISFAIFFDEINAQLIQNNGYTEGVQFEDKKVFIVWI